MAYPGAASIDCGECHKWHYDLKTGEIQKRGSSGKKVKRDGLPPCVNCPKGSPENGKLLQLHPRNARLIHFFKMVQVSGKIPSQFEDDALTLENLSLVKDLQVEADGKKEHDKWAGLERRIETIAAQK